MKLPKLPIRTMLGLLSAGLGVIAFGAVQVNNERIAKQEARYRDIMYQAMYADPRYGSPIQQVDSYEIGQQVPPNQLPMDARPMPGVTPEPGSDPKKVIWKDSGRLPVTPSRSGYAMVMEKTDKVVPKTNDPIWKVSLVDSTGKEVETVEALSGRAYRQKADRNQGGNKSPLPSGIYAVDTYGIERGPFDDPELGRGYWIPITPLFNTGRSALGFHQDPSWGKMNGESGTSGCIGLQSPEATAQVVQWIKKYHVNKLVVAS